jgi:hypothetical protein
LLIVVWSGPSIPPIQNRAECPPRVINGGRDHVRIESAHLPTTDIASDGRLLAPEIELRGLSLVKILRDRPLCVGKALAWPAVAADLHRALIHAGRQAALVNRVLDDLRPLWESVERARDRIDDDLTWALVGMVADRARRRALHDRQRAS